MLVTSIFSFSHIFLKGFFPRVIKSQDCVEKVNKYETHLRQALEIWGLTHHHIMDLWLVGCIGV